MGLPDEVQVHVQVSAEGRAVGGARVRLVLHTSTKDAFSNLVGATDSRGEIVVQRAELERHVTLLRNQFPMDHPGVDDWDGSISVVGPDPSGVQAALQAHDRWRGTPAALTDEGATSLRELSRWWSRHRSARLVDVATVRPPRIGHHHLVMTGMWSGGSRT